MKVVIHGPDIVLACPHCGASARLSTIEFAENVDAVSWTDGYREVPDVVQPPTMTRCHACRRLHWLTEAHPLGELTPGVELPPEHLSWRDAPMVEPPDENDYYEALQTGLAQGADQEIKLRVCAWWRGNDRFRKSETPGRFLTDQRAVHNLERLIELCAGGNHEILLFRAEALRQLGRFDEARDALSYLCSDYSAARERLETLIANRSRELEVLFD